VNCNHPIVTRFLIDALEYWVREMHVDGFRFDLASALGRGEDGNPLYHAPMLWQTELSPMLSRTHIIAEAWDAAGLYQVGDFPGFRWAEWNGRYRDVMRAFVRGDPGLIGEVATRIAGSSDLYQVRGRLPINSVNFITCHDGFTLWDLVSYDHKHNAANGEDNRDGCNHNLSWNCGVEGPTEDPEVLALRCRQARNFIAILMLSQGVPMLLAGDEVRHTRYGNNNAYCQDNTLSWFDWDQVEPNRCMFEFVRGLIRLRWRHPSLKRDRFFTGRPESGQRYPDIAWHGVELDAPGWHDPNARTLAFTLGGSGPNEAPLHVMLNMWEDALTFAVPNSIPGRWDLIVDTSREPGVFTAGIRAELADDRIVVAGRSLMVLEAQS
jgi:isoamylase